MWPASDAWRAPVGDFPPPWASAWGDDQFGLWADLTVNGATQRMRWIEPSGPEGFGMGSAPEERNSIKNRNVGEWVNESESALTTVVIPQGLWLADTPCTQAFWRAVIGKNPSHFQDRPDAALRPVEQVTWDDVETFFVRFAAAFDWGCAVRLGLPTESQWEYAARAGSNAAFWWGDEANSVMANWNDELGETTPVKRYPANPWGLFDVHGNVWEWCADPWRWPLDAPDAQPAPETRVVRGASWILHSDLARSASRDWRHQSNRYHDLGFRFALKSSSH